jgi:hypothetical protein
MKRLVHDKGPKTRLAAYVSSSMVLLFIILNQGTALSEQAQPAPPPVKDDVSIRELIEELYKNYEAVDRELEDLEEALEGGPTPIPLTISVKKGTAQKGFTLLSVEVKDNEDPLWSHTYTKGENEALDGGGRHEFYKGTTKKGTHSLLISYRYLSPEDEVGKNGEIQWELTVRDDAHYVEVVFKWSGSGVLVEPRELKISGQPVKGPKAGETNK